MRKSNWIIIAILVAASVLFLWMWHALQFDLVDNPLDLLVTVVWWIVIIAACVSIHFAEKKRQERIRTLFLAPGLIYNSEAGVIRLTGDADLVDEMARVLDSLQYGFDLAELPANSRVRFQRIVRSARFADHGAIWEGELVEVARPDKPKPFRSREDLAALMA